MWFSLNMGQPLQNFTDQPRSTGISDHLGSTRGYPQNHGSRISIGITDHGSPRITRRIFSGGGSRIFAGITDHGYPRTVDPVSTGVTDHLRFTGGYPRMVNPGYPPSLGSTGGYPRLVPDHGSECDRQADGKSACGLAIVICNVPFLQNDGQLSWP